MKYYIPFIVLLLIHCKKEKTQIYSGEISATVNGSSWTAKIQAAENIWSSRELDIVMDRYNASGVKKETLYLFKVKLESGRQKIHRGIPTDRSSKTGAIYLSGPENSTQLCDNYMVS